MLKEIAIAAGLVLCLPVQANEPGMPQLERQIAEHKEDLAESHYQLALFAAMNLRYDEALEHVQDAVRLVPRHEYRQLRDEMIEETSDPSRRAR
jgi:hypothetical protein